MATKQLTLTFRTVVTRVHLDVTAQKLWVEGALVRDGFEGNIILFGPEDVTALLNPTQLAAVQTLLNGAQNWVDAKMP
jgi:hypothetical protein